MRVRRCPYPFLVALAALLTFSACDRIRGVDIREQMIAHYPEGSVGVEIGVWKGGFSSMVLEKVKPSKYHLIDPWVHFDGAEYDQAWYGGDDPDGQAKMDRIYQGVLDQFAGEIDAGTVVVHKGLSSEVASEFEDEYFDWVYIDGNHLYEFVRDDLELYYPKVKPGGLITGDDYMDGQWWGDGVIRAVDEFVASGRAEVVEIRGAQFVLRKN